MKNAEELNFVRTRDFNLIPAYLFNQFKDLKCDPKDLYFWGSAAANNPLTLLYVAVNKQHKIKGFLWAHLDVLERVVHIRALTIDKDYHGGDILEKAKTVLQKEIEQYNSKADDDLKIRNTVKFYTTRSKAFEKEAKEKGWKISKQAIMEIDLMINYDPTKNRHPHIGGFNARYFDGGGTDIEQVSTLTRGQRNLLDRLTGALMPQIGQPGPVFGGERVAPLSPLQQQAFGLAGGALPLAQQAFGFGTELPQEIGQAREQLTRTMQPFDPASTISAFAPARDVAVRQFENVTVPTIMERFAGANAVRSSAAPQAIAEAGRDLSLGLSAQLGQLLQGAEQAQLNRQQAAIGQALDVARAPLGLTQAAGQVGLGLLGGISDFGAQQRALEQQRLGAEMARFREAQPFANPALNLLPLALQTPAFENVAIQGGGGLGAALGPALGSFLGTEAGAGMLASGLGKVPFIGGLFS